MSDFNGVNEIAVVEMTFEDAGSDISEEDTKIWCKGIVYNAGADLSLMLQDTIHRLEHTVYDGQRPVDEFNSELQVTSYCLHNISEGLSSIVSSGSPSYPKFLHELGESGAVRSAYLDYLAEDLDQRFFGHVDYESWGLKGGAALHPDALSDEQRRDMSETLLQDERISLSPESPISAQIRALQAERYGVMRARNVLRKAIDFAKCGHISQTPNGNDPEIWQGIARSVNVLRMDFETLAQSKETSPAVASFAHAVGGVLGFVSDSLQTSSPSEPSARGMSCAGAILTECGLRLSDLIKIFPTASLGAEALASRETQRVLGGVVTALENGDCYLDIKEHYELLTGKKGIDIEEYKAGANGISEHFIMLSERYILGFLNKSDDLLYREFPEATVIALPGAMRLQ